MERAKEEGFTLIELLVVMIIIGILAAIAIPVFLNQRQKAYDTSTKADVTNLGKEIASYYVDGSGPLTLDFTAKPGYVIVRDSAGYACDVRLTNGTAAPTTGGAPISTTRISGASPCRIHRESRSNTAAALTPACDRSSSSLNRDLRAVVRR